MTVEAIVDALKAQYDDWYLEGANRRSDVFPLVTAQSLDEWCAITVLDPGKLLDSLAEQLARRFHARELDFGFCDRAINRIVGFANADRGDFDLWRRIEGSLFWDVFQAFDGGEFLRPGHANPAESYTRPEIEALIREWDTGVKRAILDWDAYCSEGDVKP